MALKNRLGGELVWGSLGGRVRVVRFVSKLRGHDLLVSNRKVVDKSFVYPRAVLVQECNRIFFAFFQHFHHSLNRVVRIVRMHRLRNFIHYVGTLLLSHLLKFGRVSEVLGTILELML